MIRKLRIAFCKPRLALLSLLIKVGFILSDRLYLECFYYLSMGKRLDLDNPRSFCEKIQWLKLYNRKPEYQRLVDKLAVKDFVADLIGEKYVVPTIAVFDKPEDIDYDKLPNQFVLKTTHGGGSNGVVICRDRLRFNKQDALKKLEASLCIDIYKGYREWPYKGIEKKILAEPYLSDGKSEELIDYKFFCFAGKAQYCQVIANRSTEETIDFYDRAWNHQEFIGLLPSAQHASKKYVIPSHYDEMLELADMLSSAIKAPFVRIDLYNVCGQIFFGEITFFPASGIGEFKPEKWNRVLGDLINIRIND